jgi:hypothetical protein
MRTKIGLAGIVLSVGITMGFNVAHRLSVPLLIVMPLVCSAFIAAGWLTAHRCLRARRKVQDEDGPDEVPDEFTNPDTHPENDVSTSRHLSDSHTAHCGNVKATPPDRGLDLAGPHAVQVRVLIGSVTCPCASASNRPRSTVPGSYPCASCSAARIAAAR